MGLFISAPAIQRVQIQEAHAGLPDPKAEVRTRQRRPLAFLPTSRPQSFPTPPSKTPPTKNISSIPLAAQVPFPSPNYSPATLPTHTRIAWHKHTSASQGRIRLWYCWTSTTHACHEGTIKHFHHQWQGLGKTLLPVPGQLWPPTTQMWQHKAVSI